jgi:riboflavin synthase
LITFPNLKVEDKNLGDQMFTGLICEVGVVREALPDNGGLLLVLEAPILSLKTRVGDSMAVNGCCLTAVDVKPPLISFQAVPETLNRTAFGRLKSGCAVNLEPPLTLADTLGGHFVQGHVDGTAEMLDMKPEGQGVRMRVVIPAVLAPYVVEKGSIALDGISLTVAALRGNEVEVALIPHTIANTDLKEKMPGDFLHVEVDMLAKHVEKLATAYFKTSKVHP